MFLLQYDNVVFIITKHKINNNNNIMQMQYLKKENDTNKTFFQRKNCKKKSLN